MVKDEGRGTLKRGLEMGMSQEEWVEIEVINWEKYNPRSDRKSHSWFRVQNDIVAEPKFFGMSAAQKFISICLFAEISKNGGNPTKVNCFWLADQLKVKPSEIHQTIQKLVLSGVARLPLDTAWSPLDTTYTHNFQSSLTTNERTNERTNKRASVPNSKSETGYGAGFQEVYESYPRREGKSAGWKIYDREIKTSEEREALLTAIKNYRKNKVGTEARYLLMFSTFMNQWRDWIDPAAGLSRLAAPLQSFDDLVKGLA